nr:Uncharacterised protein [Klebsiella pneumoniae]
MRNRLINDATSLVKQPLGQSRYRMVVHRGRNIDSLLNQQLLTHMAAGPKPQHLTRSRMRKRERLKRSVRILQEVLPDYYYPLVLKHPEQYTRPDI